MKPVAVTVAFLFLQSVYAGLPQPYHLIITSSSGSRSYQLIKLQTERYKDNTVQSFLAIYHALMVQTVICRPWKYKEKQHS